MNVVQKQEDMDDQKFGLLLQFTNVSDHAGLLYYFAVLLVIAFASHSFTPIGSRVQAIGRAIAELDDAIERFEVSVRKIFRETNGKFLKAAMEAVLGDVEQNQKLGKGQRGDYNVDTLELMAYSWLGFYTSALSCFAKMVDICRDNFRKGWDWNDMLLKPMASMTDKAQLKSFVTCSPDSNRVLAPPCTTLLVPVAPRR